MLLVYLLAILLTVPLAVSADEDCKVKCGPNVSCGTPCEYGSDGDIGTCGSTGQRCYNPFGKCLGEGGVCDEEADCSTACNESDGRATTCGAIGRCKVRDGGKSDEDGGSPPPPEGEGTLVLEDLAFRRPTSQTSTDFGGESSRAVDGDSDGNFDHGSVTHTKQEDNPEWHVSIEPGSIESITIFNRTDCCSDRLRGAEVWIRRFSLDKWERVATLKKVAPTYKIHVGTTTRGPYEEVKIVLPGRARFLSLAEVSVTGYRLLR